MRYLNIYYKGGQEYSQRIAEKSLRRGIEKNDNSFNMCSNSYANNILLNNKGELEMIEDVGSMSAIRRGYYDQIIYYYENMGKASVISGVKITDELVKTLERRYKQLGGNLVMLHKEVGLPSKNGIKKQN